MTFPKPKALEVWPRHIPDGLKAVSGWVLWRYWWNGKKWTKPPYNVDGAKIDITNPDNWCDFTTALQTYQRERGKFDGIGFSLGAMDSLGGVDLDHCIQGGKIEGWASDIIEELGGYTETSPSGNGIRVFGLTPRTVEGRKKDNIEMYVDGRYLTTTGHRLDNSAPDLVDFDEAFGRVYDRVFSPSPDSSGPEDFERGEVDGDLAERFQALLEDDPIFRERFNSPAPVGSRSDHEFHLCARLWEERFSFDEIWTLMDSSPQTKWTARDDVYKERTIQKAIIAARTPDKDRGERSIGEAWPDFEVTDFCFEVTDDDGEPVTDKDGNPKYSFSPTQASDSIRKKAPLKMVESEPDIYRFDGQIYHNDGARKIDLTLCRVARDRVRGRDVQEVIRRVKNELLEDPVEFDCNPYLLGVRNGVVDLRTGEFRDYLPDDLITYQIDVTYDPGARCPRYVQFLEEIQPNVTDRLTLVDWFPATAIRKPLPYVLFLLGLGRNGKGVYERLIKRFFGPAAFRDMSLSEVTKNNFAAGTFYKKLGWIATEQSGKKKATIGTDFIKLVTGAGSIDADRKNLSRIQFEAYFQAIVDTNSMPLIEDTSIGWMERFCKQDLPFHYVSDPDPDNPLERKKDPHLLDKLTTDEELSGILNLLIWRAREICETETITKRPATELFNEYAQQSASVSTFCDLFLEYEEGLTEPNVPTIDIYEAYKTWCSFLVGEVVDEAYFGRYLKRLCNNRNPSRPRRGGKRFTAYPGLLFHKDKVNVAIEALSNGWTSKDKHGQVVDEKDFSKTDNKSTSGTSGQVELWNQVVKRFGLSRPVAQDEDFLSKEEIHQNARPTCPPVQPIAGGPKTEKPTCPLPVHTRPLPVQDDDHDHHGDEDEKEGVEVVAGDSEPYETIADNLEEADKKEAEHSEKFKTPEPEPKDEIPDEIRAEALGIVAGLNGKAITFGNVEAYLEAKTGEFAPPKAVSRVLRVLASMGGTTDKNGVLTLPEEGGLTSRANLFDFEEGPSPGVCG